MKKIKITQIRSSIGCNFKHKSTLKMLGLKKIGSCIEKVDNPSVRGMINLINYILKIE